MHSRNLARFIDKKRNKIVAEWQAFAQTLQPAASGMTAKALRDHANDILTAIVHDMSAVQSSKEQKKKSKGHGTAKRLSAIGDLHAKLRLEDGFKVGQLVAEYRALRASVLRLWETKGDDPNGVTRFNEAIDEALSEAIGRFTTMTDHFRDQSLGIMTHDLRNPLSAIVLGCEVLMASEGLDDKSIRVAARMSSAALRMGRMIEDLLDLTRTRFGDQIPVLRVPADLEPICRQVVSELEGLRSTGSLRFTARGSLQGDWDADRIAQVLSNLIRNAIQHGGSDALITIFAEEKGDAVELKVHNRGRTIPKSALTTIFDPMIRHVGTDHRNVGLGLGLYIAMQIVLAHGGTLSVVSTSAAGTTFTAHLPRTAAVPQPDPSPSAP